MCEAMSTHELKELLSGGYQPQGSPEIAAPGTLPSIAQNQNKEKNRLQSFCPAFGGQTALVAEVNEGSQETRKRKLASDNQLQHDPKAA